MLRRRRHAQAQAARKTEGRKKTDEAGGKRRNSSGGFSECVEEITCVSTIVREYESASVREGAAMQQETSQNADKKPRNPKGKFREYAEVLITAALVALVIRSFVIEAFKIPSGSMLPTLSIGDHIFVNKFVYGFRIPYTKKHYFAFRDPQRGDVIVFMYPEDEDKDFIKRVVCLPGDRIRIGEENVSVNGERLPLRPLEADQDPDDKRLLVVKNGKTHTIPFERGWRDFNYYEEGLGEKEHLVQYEKFAHRPTYDALVPPDHLFVMGDNRDNSADSREWGFVHLGNVKGKAMFVWLSLDRDQGGIRWHEFG